MEIFSLSLDNRKTDFDQSGNLSFDDVTGTNGSDPGGSAGQDEVPLLQGEVLRDVAAAKRERDNKNNKYNGSNQ